MIKENEEVCPNCGGSFKYYDKVQRIVRTKNRMTSYILLRRLKCMTCYKVYRVATDEIFPYKQYEAELIRGVLEGLITSDTLGYEDYPCEMTMTRWRYSQGKLVL